MLGESTLRCVRCGRAASPGLLSCADCGGALAAAPPPAPDAPPTPAPIPPQYVPSKRPPAKATGLFVFLACAGVVGILCAVAFGFYAKDHKGKLLAALISYGDPPAKGKYPSSFSTDFVKRCQTKEQNADEATVYCPCIMDESEKRLPFTELLRVVYGENPNSEESRVWEAVLSECRQRSSSQQ